MNFWRSRASGNVLRCATEHVVSIEPTTAPEPNRPWFGGQLKSRRATHDSDSASDDGDTEEDVPSSIPMHTRTGTTTDL
eukprot:m.283167 g.283167  ORF g.283167 m.283167 type:complete len:79 (+) comp19871_c0_seq6:2640-2876(+)